MSTTTTRNQLTKPGYADAADVAVLNADLDIVDAAIAKCNYAATGAPAVTDDSGDGYAIGSVWFDTTNNNIYVAKSVSVGAAVWTKQAAHNNYGASSAPTVDDDITLHYAPGSIWVDTTNHNVYICETAGDGAALWKQVNSASITGYVKTDGSTPLTANWDVGAYKVTANQLESDVATGTAPIVVASTTKVTNLNADQLDGLDDTAFVKQTLADAKGDIISASAADTWAKTAVGTDGEMLIANSTATGGVSWAKGLSGQSLNLLINGTFNVNQYGIGQFTSTTNPANNDDTYMADQWTLLSDGNDVMDVWVTESTGPINRGGSLLLQTETANKKAGIIQFIEYKNCRYAIGDVVSLRFSAYTTSANPNANIMAGVLSWSGTQDTVTSDVVSAWEATNTAPTLIANWTYENVPARLALVADTWTEYKIENISINTANTTNIAVFIWLDDTDSAVDDRVYISGVQLNVGSKCLPWSSRDFNSELAACQRHLIVINSAAGAYPHLGNGTANSTSVVYVEYEHPTEWFKTLPPMTLVGSNWVIAANAISAYASEGDKKQITYRCTGTGTPFTQYYTYVVYGNNDTASRMYIQSRM